MKIRLSAENATTPICIINYDEENPPVVECQDGPLKGLVLLLIQEIPDLNRSSLLVAAAGWHGRDHRLHIKGVT